MIQIIPKIKSTLLVSLAALLAAAAPMTVFADSSTTPCVPPPSSQAGVHKPVGADASTYTYNCDTGLWENAHYTYDPATGLTTPIDPVVYTYNPSTGMYDTTTWVYDAPTNNYDPVTTSVIQPPTGADVVGAPAPVVATTPQSGSGSSISNTGPGSTNTINNNGGTTGSSSINNTGPDSTNTIGGTSNNDTNLNNANNANITNLLNSSAASGNAIVLGNTTGGDATSGNAQDVANQVNMLQSSTNALGGKTVTFVANIDGDVNGDLLIDPSSLGAVQPATDGTSGNNNLTVNNQNNNTITNNLNLDAASGDATVANNTSGGSATTGSADAIANVVNLIDSAITSGNSFIGVININGNLNGNILVPPDLINQLVASNVPTVSISDTGPDSQNSITSNTGSNTTNVTNTNNEGITNNVNANAASGTATVANNTSAGNATTGNATTNITAFNLTGGSVVGANDLLVFVNVLGSWVGMIVNAPAGATAAELGGGITSTTPSTGNNSTTVNNANNDKITNNINANATSGNAAVTSNTSGGNATSGNADSAVNLLNVEDSNLSLSGWFGMLFINVFGTWHGDFGTSPSASASNSSNSSGSSSGDSGGSNDATVPSQMQVFRFVPTGSNSDTGSVSSNTSGSGSASGSFADSAATLEAAHIATTKNGAPAPQLQSSHSSMWLPVAGVALFALYVVGDVFFSRRSQAAHQQ